MKDQEELEKVQRYICNRAAGVCKKKPPPLTKTRKHDEKFQAMSVRTARPASCRAFLVSNCSP